ncbi:hypothetical protein F5Y18DRAFT_247379 [Xylariaceae sp. FL1019]|nr:hypothetical protein F5Y18DRAFT_247379 [Xylariaceae sp. FL1019]
MSSLAAAKLNGNGKRLAPPSPANSNTSPTRSAGSPSSAAKRQKRDNVISIKDRASTPTPAAAAAAAKAQDFGSHMMTQLTYAVDYLKSKREPKTLHEVMGHLTMNKLDQKDQKVFATLMHKHSRITFIPDKTGAKSMPEWARGRYEFKAKLPGVRDKISLLDHLQRKTDASAVVVKDLKDGWPDCDAAISELEAEHKILVVRTKKDNYAKYIWMDQALLNHGTEPEFLAMWHKFEVPSENDIVRKLTGVGQKPASEDPRLKKLDAPKQQAKKRKSTKPPKHQSNSHMAHLLKDYTHLKRG